MGCGDGFALCLSHAAGAAKFFRKLVLNNETKNDCMFIDPWPVGWDCVWLWGVFAIGAGGEAGQAGAFFGADAGWRHVYGKRSGGEGSDADQFLDDAVRAVYCGDAAFGGICEEAAGKCTGGDGVSLW